MSDSRQAAVIAALVERLREHGSWAGETHVQKAVYFLQTLLGVPLGFRFTLYKYGPFSFGLRQKLTEMRGDRQLVLEPQPAPYGPRLAATPSAQQLESRFPRTLRQYQGQLDFIASRLGDLGVGSLERLATALMVTIEDGDDPEVRADRLVELKPHITRDAAREAIEDIEQMSREAVPLRVTGTS